MTDKDNNKTTYTYDALDRLKQAQTKASNGSGALVDDYLYSCDAASNRTEQKVQIGSNPQTVTSYAYNHVNRLCWKAAVAIGAD